MLKPCEQTLMQGYLAVDILPKTPVARGRKEALNPSASEDKGLWELATWPPSPSITKGF